MLCVSAVLGARVFGPGGRETMWVLNNIMCEGSVQIVIENDRTAFSETPRQGQLWRVCERKKKARRTRDDNRPGR
jgi:hypothetical protein